MDADIFWSVPPVNSVKARKDLGLYIKPPPPQHHTFAGYMEEKKKKKSTSP